MLQKWALKINPLVKETCIPYKRVSRFGNTLQEYIHSFHSQLRVERSCWFAKQLYFLPRSWLKESLFFLYNGDMSAVILFSARTHTFMLYESSLLPEEKPARVPRCYCDLYCQIQQSWSIGWDLSSPGLALCSTITDDAAFLQLPITTHCALPNNLLVSSSDMTSMPKVQSFNFSWRDPLTWHHFPSGFCYHFPPQGSSLALHESIFLLHLHQHRPPTGISTVL